MGGSLGNGGVGAVQLEVAENDGVLLALVPYFANKVSSRKDVSVFTGGEGAEVLIRPSCNHKCMELLVYPLL